MIAENKGLKKKLSQLELMEKESEDKTALLIQEIDRLNRVVTSKN